MLTRAFDSERFVVVGLMRPYISDSNLTFGATPRAKGCVVATENDGADTD